MMPKTALFAAFLVLLFQPAVRAQSIFDSTKVRQSTEIYFDFGKSELSQASQLAIDSVANYFLNDKNASTIRITAHTDSIGSMERNLVLSQKRAAVVESYLKNKQIPQEKISIAAFGKKQPVASNATDSGRQRNRRATLDVISLAKMATYSGKITDKNTGKGLEAKLIFSTKELKDSILTDTSGRYSVRLQENEVVRIDVESKGYFFKSQVTKIYGSPELAKNSQKTGDLVLTPTEKGQKASIANLFFVGNEAILLKSSEPELPRVLKFMQINPHLKIEIGGHVNHPNLDPKKIDKREFDLSVNRAKLVYDYLIKNGISEKQISYKGYGNSQMLFPKGGTEEQQEQNRRVEIKVL